MVPHRGERRRSSRVGGGARLSIAIMGILASRLGGPGFANVKSCVESGAKASTTRIGLPRDTDWWTTPGDDEWELV